MARVLQAILCSSLLLADRRLLWWVARKADCSLAKLSPDDVVFCGELPDGAEVSLLGYADAIGLLWVQYRRDGVRLERRGSMAVEAGRWSRVSETREVQLEALHDALQRAAHNGWDTRVLWLGLTAAEDPETERVLAWSKQWAKEKSVRFEYAYPAAMKEV